MLHGRKLQKGAKAATEKFSRFRQILKSEGAIALVARLAE
jgi:hypothetical protein